ncbi:MAG: tetratricopeptide repeat protein [Pirellulaceae bacterium]|jgi:tetratricopeptide (TPR) repeat protein|nr:tetratricopeptide repeat protein [Pirellulaceae bacterium]
MTMQRNRQIWWGWTWAAWLLAARSLAAQEGQPDLDKAMELKITATTLQQLGEVAALCEQAIQKGLSKEDEAFARQLLIGSLYQRAEQIMQPLVRAPMMTPELRELRQRVVADLEKIIGLDARFGPAHLRLAQLQVLDAEDLPRARDTVDQAVKCLADDKKLLAEALLLRGGLQPDQVQQLADFSRAVELDPDNPDVWQARAMYYLQQNQVDQAIADFNSLLARDEDNWLARLAVADALISARAFDQALEQLNQVIAQKPTPLAYTLRARLWTQQGKLAEAVQDLDAAAKLDPNDMGLLLMRARLYLQEGRNALAQQDVERVLQASPENAQAMELRSLVLAAMRKFPEAVRDLRQLLQREPDNKLLKLQLAQFLTAGNQSREAIEVYNQLLQEEPQNVFALRGRGDAYLNVGEHKPAIADYEAAVRALAEEKQKLLQQGIPETDLQIFEPDSGLLNNFSWVLSTSPDDSLRDGKRAQELALKACELTEYSQAHILSTLAAAYAETGDFEAARKWSQKSVELGDDEIRDQLRQELESYQQNKPWREKKEEPPAAPDTLEKD